MTDETATAGAAPGPEDVPQLAGMPMLGYGTWELTGAEACADAVATALEAGYRHVDTAKIYDNERAVGDGIARASVDREEVFLATKVWIDALGYEDAIHAARASLDRLGTDHVDLLYVHWPARAYDPADTLAAFDELVDTGVTDRIGVSNFTPAQLAEACERASSPVFATQFECHPLLAQDRLLEACEAHDVAPVAYSPLARGRVTEMPEITEIAADRDASPAQVSLAWLRQRGVAAIPKAASADHVRDNWASVGLSLDDAEMARIDAIDRTERLIDPEYAPWN